MPADAAPPWRVVFLGTGDIALPAFRCLLDDPRTQLAALVTQPDKPAGRGKKPRVPRIKEVAAAHGVAVLQPEKAKEAIPALDDLHADLFVVMAYGQILPRDLIDLPRLACWNLHASLLPRHRGASPIQAALLAGDAETGVTVMHVVPALDAGDMVVAEKLAIDADETGESLHDKLAELAPQALLRALDLLEPGTPPRTPQDPDQVTVLGKLSREDGRLDWSRPGAELERRIRAFHPWPGTHTTLPDGSLLKIFPPAEITSGSGSPGEVLSTDNHGLTVATGDGALALTEVQPAGKRRMSVGDFLRGHAVAVESRLG